MTKKEELTNIPSIPSPESLKKHIKEISDIPVQPESVLTDSVKSTIPSIGIVGCGGCGTNLIKGLKLLPTYNVKKYVVDTSLSNIRDISKDVNLDIVESNARAIGSGRIRKTNAKEIQQNVSKFKCITDNNDITIVIHSTSGGSGSVIGPLVCKQLAINKKAFIVITVLDTTCRVSTNNTINTINSYKQMSETEGFYVPISHISNNIGKGAANEFIYDFIDTFITGMMSAEVEDMDLQNKLNFLRPGIINESLSGLYEIRLFKLVEELEDVQETIHSLYFLNNTGETYDIDLPNSLISYISKMNGVKDKAIIAFTLGTELSKDTVEYLQTKLEHFHSMAIVNESATAKIGGNKNIGSNDSSGLIL